MKIWNNLKELKCIDCKCALIRTDFGYMCGNPKCSFKISHSSLATTLERLNKPVKLGHRKKPKKGIYEY